MKVAHLVKTKSLESDGRVLKWIDSLRDRNIMSEVFTLEDSNKKETYQIGTTMVHSIRLLFRKLFGKGNGYIFKVPEFTLKTLRYFNKSNADIFIFHDMQHYLSLLYLCLDKRRKKNRTIVWDLHELPHPVFFKIPWAKKVLRYLLEHVDFLVYTSNVRREYMHEQLEYLEKDFYVLNNYPDLNFLKQSVNSRPRSLELLRSGKPYILWLGAAVESRNFTTFFEAFKQVHEDYNLVILGTVEKCYTAKLKEYIDRGIAYNDFVRQEELIKYIDNCEFSVVLYNSSTPNNLYCEPNRLYQLVGRSKPVLVGDNPTMKSLVEELEVGVVLMDDGSNIDLMVNGLKDMISTIDIIKERISRLSETVSFSWDDQFGFLYTKILTNYRK